MNWTRNDEDALFCVLWNEALLMTTEKSQSAVVLHKSFIGSTVWNTLRICSTLVCWDAEFTKFLIGMEEISNLHVSYSSMSAIFMMRTSRMCWDMKAAYMGRWNTYGVLDPKGHGWSRLTGEIHVTMFINEIKYLLGLDLSGLGWNPVSWSVGAFDLYIYVTFPYCPISVNFSARNLFSCSKLST